MRRIELPYRLCPRGSCFNCCHGLNPFLVSPVEPGAYRPTWLINSMVVYFRKLLVSRPINCNFDSMADSSQQPVSQVCSRFHRAIELIGSRWTGAILRTLLAGRTRSALITAAIPDITDRMLSERLRSLEDEDLVVRSVIPETPVRVEYELTQKGRELQDALDEIGNW